MSIDICDRVVIERDVTRYRSKGTWPQFRGWTGTVVQTNLGEYGVVFGKVTFAPTGVDLFNSQEPLRGSNPTSCAPVGRPHSEF